MNNYFIPIIGTISAGKTTFFNSLLGLDILETGCSTTTKFVCLIKNSDKLSFYHVIPKKEENISFIKEGEEIIEEKDIKEKIKKLNEDLSSKIIDKNDIFYILETPIKNIENNFLLENCYFMDIPGLNESNNSYIENIFSLFNPNDILFEIMIFDSNYFKSNSVLKIINQLEKKKCLKKEKNIFILNKIDLCEEKKDKVISQFKQHFYQTYEDDKNQDSLKININNNYFIPINSLLLGSEIKADNDFTSFLLLELFNYIELNNGDITTFFTYLKKKIKNFNFPWRT